MDTDELDLKIYDIRVEAEWDTDTGGPCQLTIDTPATLPFAIVDEPYEKVIDGACGITPYSWDDNGSLPSWLSFDDSHQSDPDYRIYGTPTVANIGTHTFTLTLEDGSTPTQDFTRQFSLTVSGLAINPPGPDLPVAIKGKDYVTNDVPPEHHKFTPQGVDGDAKWRLLSGSPPPGMMLAYTLAHLDLSLTASAIYNNAISLIGTPTDDGTYAFTIKLEDTDTEETAIHDYLLTVLPSGVTILDRVLKPMIKGMRYGNATAWPYQPMEARSLMAVRADQSASEADIDWIDSGTPGLPDGLDLDDWTLRPLADISKVYIVGTIGVTEPSGNYTFRAKIVDVDEDHSDLEDFVLKVLDRKTKILKAPPSTVKLPSDGGLSFVVTGKGGAPSIIDGGSEYLCGKSSQDFVATPYYTYAWQVTPVEGTNSPALDPPSGTTSVSSSPVTIPITFEASSNNPVTGTYDVMFWAQDWIAREDKPPDPAPADPADHPAGPDANDSYEFKPAKIRIKVIAPAGQALGNDIGRPTKSRQESLR